MKRFLVLLMLTMLLLSGCKKEEPGPFAHVPNPQAVIELSDGTSMRFELFVQDAPNTVANFVQLAEEGFYNGQIFFRIVPGAFIQSGSPDNTITGRAAHTIQGEFEKNGIENNIAHTRGTISMSRQEDYDSASSQFFIMQGNYPEYNGEYAAFGRATDAESLAVIDKLAGTMIDGNYYPLGTVPRIVRISVDTHDYSYEAARIEEKDEPALQEKSGGFRPEVIIDKISSILSGGE